MRVTFNRRLTMIMLVLITVGGLLMGRLAYFQFQLDVTYLRNMTGNAYFTVNDRLPERGRIFDRNGELLAGNMTEYVIGVSPNYISDRETAATEIAIALNDDYSRILALLNSRRPYELLTPEPVSSEVAQAVARLEYSAITIEPRPKRVYPQNSLAAQLIGFMSWDGSQRRGYVGVEGEYNSDLAGQSRVYEESRIPFEVNANEQPRPGRDIVLTIDRSIQHLAETELQEAIETYGAKGGTVVIMNPRTGEILAMASYPSFDPNVYYNVSADAMRNAAISDAYEPGSVFKVVTAALALEHGGITRDFTYIDSRIYEIGGIQVYNWDRAGHGSTVFDDILVRSWNVGTTTLAVDVLGRDRFYKGLQDFGVGSPTGIDLEGESGGIFELPGGTYWTDANLATNSFGQGLSVTPLQMLSFVNGIANGGQIMQPHIRLRTIDGENVYNALPVAVRTPISPEVAADITDIMVQVINRGEGDKAYVYGYTVAGKTGTAEIACSEIENSGCTGYHPTLHNLSFVGFLPADEPRVSIIIKLDELPGFASESAAPAFKQLVERLVVLMNIPTDEQRRQLREAGGNTAEIALR